MKRFPLAWLCLTLVLLAPGPVWSGEHPPSGTGIPSTAMVELQSYVGVSHNVLDNLDEAMKVKNVNPRTLKKTHWEDICATADKGRGLYLANASKFCKNAGLKGLPLGILEWQTEDNIRWSFIRSVGARFFANRNFMAQFVNDLSLVDGPAWYEKKKAIFDAGEEIDKEYQRLKGVMDSLSSRTKAQLEGDQKDALQMVFMTQAVAGKCRDLKKEFEGWYLSKLKPDVIKGFYTKTLNELVFDKQILPTFFTHKQTWKKHLDDWLKKYKMFHTDFGNMIKEFGKEKGVFKGHGKCLENLTFDQIENDLANEFRRMFNSIGGEIRNR